MKDKSIHKIFVNHNVGDNSVNITIPPLRSFNLFEIEDNYEAVCAETKRHVDEETAAFAIRFFAKVKYALEYRDVHPLVVYFQDQSLFNSAAQKQQTIAMLEQLFYHVVDDKRLMH